MGSPGVGWEVGMVSAWTGKYESSPGETPLLRVGIESLTDLTGVHVCELSWLCTVLGCPYPVGLLSASASSLDLTRSFPKPLHEEGPAAIPLEVASGVLLCLL